MPMKRLSMRKLKEVLRLRYELGLWQRQIARSCSIGQGTVYEYLKRAEAAGVTWPLPEGWEDRQLEAALFGGTPRRAYETRKPPPDFAQLHEELQRHPHLTLQLAWEEYRQTHPDGYAYSRFCELYQQWRQRLDVVLRQDHPAGEKLFVDYAGATIPLCMQLPQSFGMLDGYLGRELEPFLACTSRFLVRAAAYLAAPFQFDQITPVSKHYSVFN